MFLASVAITLTQTPQALFNFPLSLFQHLLQDVIEASTELSRILQIAEDTKDAFFLKAYLLGEKEAIRWVIKMQFMNRNA